MKRMIMMRSNILAILNNSRIISSFKEPDRLNRIWENSFFYRILNLIINSPLEWLQKVYARNENFFLSSITGKLLSFIAKYFNILIGMILILTMIIPDHRWYNLYGVLLTLGLFLMFIIKIIITEEARVDLRNIDFTLIIFFTSIFIAAATSLFPRDSINYLIYYFITFLTLVTIVSTINSYEELYNLIKIILIGVVLTALYGAYQWLVVGVEVNPSLTDLSINQGMGGRVYSTMGNPNIYGELLVLTLPFFGPVVLNEKSFVKKGSWALLMLPVLVILLKTGSRSAWVSFAFAVFVFVFFWNKKYIPYLILLGLLALPFLPSSIYRRFLTIFNPNDSSLQYRQRILGSAFLMLKDYWVTGVGLGNRVFSVIYQRYKSLGLTTVAHTHNLYVQMWLEAGVMALLSFLYMLIRLIKHTFVSTRLNKDKRLNNILIAALAGILGLCVMGFADHIWFYNRMLYMFWINVAIILATLKLINRK